MREIRNLFRFIPFGKFSLSGRGRPPFNQVYVGRQEERSNFIELLTHQEQFGAFLISGHRGAGKSSFVEYCLNEYEQMAFQRSIRISRGSQFAGALNLVLIALAITTIYVLLSQFLELAAQNTFEAILSETVENSTATGFASSNVLWMFAPFLAGSLLMVAPGYMAMRTASAIADLHDTPWARAAHYWSTLTLMLVIPVTWLLIWQFRPLVEVNIQSIFIGFVWILIPLMTQAQLVQMICKSGRFRRRNMIWMTRFAIASSIFAGLISLYIFAGGAPFIDSLVGLTPKDFENSDSSKNSGLIDDTGLTLLYYGFIYFTACAAYKHAFGSIFKPTWLCLNIVGFLISFTYYLHLQVGLFGGDAASMRTYILTSLGILLVAFGIIYYLGCFYCKRWYEKEFRTAWFIGSIFGFVASFAIALWVLGLGQFEFFENSDQKLRTLALIPLVLFLVIFGITSFFSLSFGKDFKNDLPFAPVKTILLIKANFFMLLSLVGILPVLRVIGGWLLVKTDASFKEISLGLPQLSQTHIGMETFFTVFVILALIYRCEFLWICRDLRSFRQDQAMGMLGRSPTQPNMPEAWPATWKRSSGWNWRNWPDIFLGWKTTFNPYDTEKPIKPEAWDQFTNARDFHKNMPLTTNVRETNSKRIERALIDERYGSSPLSSRARYVFRKLELATLPNWIYSVRHPVLKVWINLGFDNLEHSRIVEAMLRRLRGVYRSRFINLTSAIGGMNAALLIFAAVLTTSFASKSIFHIGNISEFDRKDGYTYRFEGNAVSSRDTFGATNYCGFFEVYPEVAPVAKNLICALPFANAITELLYSPILQIHTDFRSEIPLHRKTYGNGLEDCSYTSTFGLPLAEKLADGPRPPSPFKLDGKSRPPIGYVDWSKCIGPETSGTNVIGENDAEKKVRHGLYEMFVGDLDDQGQPSSKRQLVGESELVLYILDPNHGLPLIDYQTQTGKSTPSMLTWQPAFSPYAEGQDGSPTLRVYHLLLYALIFMLLFTINRRLRILPYQSNIDAMDELILLINGRETLRSGDQDHSGWLATLWPFRKNERTIETSGDPRVVEQRFIELLNRMRPHQPSYTDGPANLFEVVPEITFVFDEMDKLSGVVDPELSKDAEGQTQVEENGRERARSLQLHQLLSDMKRLISGHSARFIFIGGRLYHDEWLADQAQRAPILNSIFSGQIYLPSLMADRHHTFGRMNDRITELVILMYRNARHRYYGWRALRSSGPFASSAVSEEPTYVQFDLPYSSHPRRLSALAHLVGMKVIDADGDYYSVSSGALRAKAKESGSQKMTLGEQETFDQFINFLTYRSAGNPKKLKELIQSLVQTSSYAFALPRHQFSKQARVRWTRLRSEAHDVITLNDGAIYRMQFIDMLYRHLADHTEAKMLKRDDKVSMSIFYLMDFLMKFHNRGFSRTNLQRVDELSHIHRAPDLRSVMSLLVQVSSERFLHRVLNGVYNFRFRSDFAREIDYLSRISKEEMAALNFTLDESQSLKGLYQQTINTGERENIDTISGLGELYEYDQEYEIARNYYRRAVAMLDDVQGSSVMSRAVRHGDFEGNNDVSDRTAAALAKNGETDAGRSFVELGMLGELLSKSKPEDARKIIASQIHWVVARLRLMLQIGQTYEQEQNFERAIASYMHSARFSNTVLDALFQDSDVAHEDQVELSHQGLTEDSSKLFGKERTVPLVILRNLSIFYQAGFAAAWVLEKDPDNIDDSIVYAESWIKRLYAREPLLQLPLPPKEDYAMSPPFSGSILLQGCLAHDRMGDLYFMKGQQSIKSVKLDVIIQSLDTTPGNKEQNKRKGYLWRAQYNYAMSVWLLRKYLSNRFRIAGKSWSVLDKETEPFESGSITSSQFHVTLADVLTDLAEVILAGRSALRLSRDLHLPENDSERFPGAVNLKDIHLYRRCIRAFINQAIERFNTNLTVSGGKKPLKVRDWIVSKGKIADSLLDLSWDNPKDSPLWQPHFGARWDDIGPDFKKFIAGHGISFGNFSQWVGRRKTSTEKFVHGEGQHMEGLEFAAPGTELERLLAYKFFSQAAARANQAIGQSTNTSNEFLLQADALNATLWDAKTLRYLVKSAEPRKESSDGNTLRLNEFCDTISKGRGAASDHDQFHIGLLSLTSILDAIKRIQFSDRPSATRLALNHGNPSSNEGLMGAKGAEWEEMRADYDMAQAFRDDPRAITQACSLILALLHEETGPLCTGLALLVYRDVLVKYAHETFFPPAESDDALHVILRLALETGVLPPSGQTTKQGKLDDAKNAELRQALFRETYAGLCVILERYRYPILNRLNGLKVLADALVLQTPEASATHSDPTPPSVHLLNRSDFAAHFGTERNSQIARFVRELTATADVYGSDLHFPVDRAGQTMALTFLHMRHYGLHAIYDDMVSDPPDYESTDVAATERARFYREDDLSNVKAEHRPLLNETILTRESVGEMAVNRLNRSQESFSMGDAYYENVGYLNYLNDDFNDRSIHYFHATAMAHADLSELLSLFVKEGFPI